MPIKHFYQRSRAFCIWSGAAVMLCSALISPAAAAPEDAQAEIARLMQSGQLGEAMKRVDGALMMNPTNPRMRFSKGIILAQQGKPTEAIAVLLKLTEDHPDLPEPYNNLAVLYAANGQYESARIALDKAIANNPGYGMAHENLGDVYAELAVQAYEKAARLDGSAGAKAKVAAIRANVQAAAPGITRPASPPSSSNLASAAGTTAVAPRAVVDRKTAQKPEPGLSGTAPRDDSEQGAVLSAVAAWASAWSARDVKAYLASYSSDFVTPRGMSHDAWAAERTGRITSKQRISVKVETPTVTLNGDQATVQFRQQFTSDKLRATDLKTLNLIKRDGVWRIREERVG